MASCCHADPSSTSGTGAFFSKYARKYIKRFRKRGLAKEQRYLVEGITSRPTEGKTILEIGCGVGGLHLTLLKRGAASVVGVDVAEGMLDGARQLSREMHFEERTEYIAGDFVRMEEPLPSGDIVILDKVICCYEQVGVLVEKSLAKSCGMYAVSFPRPNALVRFFFTIPIVAGKLLKWSFHPYWHDWLAIMESIRRNGFQEIYENSTLLWSVRVFEKTNQEGMK